VKIAGKVLVVTGAGDGFGRAVTLEALRRGAYRVLIGREARMKDALYRINPSGAAACIARQMKAIAG
jgi:NAD(P)-dependent dehydrogenase (short-subunit alcohol dehydrogenase family)